MVSVTLMLTVLTRQDHTLVSAKLGSLEMAQIVWVSIDIKSRYHLRHLDIVSRFAIYCCAQHYLFACKQWEKIIIILPKMVETWISNPR